jgi:hypothetical protein
MQEIKFFANMMLFEKLWPKIAWLDIDVFLYLLGCPFQNLMQIVALETPDRLASHFITQYIGTKVVDFKYFIH